MNRKYNTNSSHDYSIKILMIGDSSVGKTSIMMRYANDKFSSSFITTIGIDFITKNIEMSGKKVRLQIWDTAGQERFRAITTSYFKGANIILVIYDVSDESTFENVKYWLQTINDCTSDYSGIILVGNKIDLEVTRKISYGEGAELAKKYNIEFFECSAKKNINVDSIFEEATKIHIKNFDKYFNNNNGITINADVQSDKKKCCN